MSRMSSSPPGATGIGPLRCLETSADRVPKTTQLDFQRGTDARAEAATLFVALLLC